MCTALAALAARAGVGMLFLSLVRIKEGMCIRLSGLFDPRFLFQCFPYCRPRPLELSSPSATKVLIRHADFLPRQVLDIIAIDRDWVRGNRALGRHTGAEEAVRVQGFQEGKRNR